MGPGGGDVDRIPPQIIEVYPQNGTTNFNENYFEITFSEWVEKRSVQDAIFISPPIQNGLEYDWSGKSLSVYFKDSLKSNTTYTITIGAEVEDLNNRNKMAEPVTFAFSTGTKIDTGKISGKIYGNDPGGTMVFAYSANDSIPNPAKQKPDYISQVGKNGKYTLLGLSSGNYDVYAFRDKFRDFIYQSNDDEYGVQSRDLNLSDSVKEITDVNFFLSLEDTISPKMSNVYMRDRNHFLIEFSEPIDTTKILASNFYLYDSTLSKTIPAKYFYKGNAKENQYYLSIADSLIPGNNIYLHGSGIFDRNSNRSNKESNAITVKNDRDTTAPKLLKIGGLMPDDKVDFELPVISVKFDDGFAMDSLRNAIVISDVKNIEYPFEILRRDDSWFEVNIKSKLKPRTEYVMNFDLKYVADAAGNKVDSVYKYKFSTVNDLDFSGVSGGVENINGAKKTFIVLQNVDDAKKVYKEKVDSKNNFNIQKVLPGKYLLWSFKDKNGNNVYDYGKVVPLTYSEEFIFYPDTLNLRARWPVGDVKIKFNK